MKLMRLLILVAFLAPIVPTAADMCCAAETDACSSVLIVAGASISSENSCDESHTTANACETCTICHTSLLSATSQSSAPLLRSSRTSASGIVPNLDPTRLVLTPPPSLA